MTDVAAALRKNSSGAQSQRSLFVQVTTFLYRCPTTGYNVQGFVPDRPALGNDVYEGVTCTACRGVHLVNPTTGT
jgi:hypothetical protein